MNSNILETNKIYKAIVLEAYSKDLYKIGIMLNSYFSTYYINYVCNIINNDNDLTKINTIINQFHQDLYVKIIKINKILTVEFKIKELNQYINIF